ncbi:MAG: adenylosuccinate synthase [Polyangiaceae bacterium]|nr:adenylosuccinate synthase [Polyangiaceae bacterium]
MPAIIVIGAQWGDEGKGKIVDLYAERAGVVVRYAGGPNAGHTLVVHGDKLVLRLLPSGVLRTETECLLGQGMVLDLATLREEIGALTRRGIPLAGRLFVSERAHLILPHHVLVDGLREAGDAKIGTTKRGVGPCYEDKAARRGMRLGDLRDPARARRVLETALAAWQPVVEALGARLPAPEPVLAALAEAWAELAPYVCDTSVRLDAFVRKDALVLCEGAQGTLLDLDHGTYPFVTSSSAVAGGACTGAGIGPTRIRRVLGVTKAYTTRVGDGPFPTELAGAAGDHLRQRGVEFGSVTGRPRRTGWLDLPGLRYARRVNGLDGLCVTKLDVLDDLEHVEVCVAYDTPSGRTAELPVDELALARPVYARLPGWRTATSACRELSALPAAARAYLDFVARETELPIYCASVGPNRDETIALRDPYG